MNYSLDTRDKFLYNLAYINNRSRDANLSFWNYFHSGWRVDVCGPTEGKAAWQMYASVLHGSRGLLHFILTGGPGDIPNPHVQPPPPPSLMRAGLGDVDHGYPGILTYEGEPAAGPVYGFVKKLNSVFRAWGPHLMRLRSPPGAQIYLRYGADADPSKKLVAAGAPLRNISDGEFNIGLFVADGVSSSGKGGNAVRDATWSHGVMIQNHDAANFRFATVEWAFAVMEVDASDGRAKPVVDAAPHVSGFQIVLGAGVARLYIYDGASGYA